MRIALAIVAGCAPTMTEMAEHSWHALDTPHLHVETDVELAAARKQAEVLEREYLQTVQLFHELGGAVPDRLVIRIVIFNDCYQRERASIGWADESHDVDEPPALTTCRSANDDENAARARRQLAWVLSPLMFGALPEWLAYGLGEYVRDATRRGGVVVLGSRYVDRELAFESIWAPDWGQNFERNDWSAAERAVQAMLDTSKATRAHTEAYLAAVTATVSEREAWARTMRPVEPEIRRSYDQWTATDHQVWKTWTAPDPASSPAVRTMSAAEAAARFVDLCLPKRPGKPIWGRPTRAWNALRKLDGNGDATQYWRAVLAYRTGAAAQAGNARGLFTQYVARRPDDPRGHLGLVAVSLDDVAVRRDPARLAALEPSVTKAIGVAATATALEIVGRYWRLRGKPEVARPFLTRALARDRSCDRCYDTLGAILYDQRDLGGALSAEERAIVAADDGGPTGAMLTRLVRIHAAVARP